MNDKRIREAFETWEDLSRTPDELIAYESRLKAVIDEEARLADAKREGEDSGLEKGIEKGRKEGLEEGMQTEKRHTAYKLLKTDMDIEEIVEITGLTKEDIKKIQKNS